MLVAIPCRLLEWREIAGSAPNMTIG